MMLLMLVGPVCAYLGGLVIGATIGLFVGPILISLEVYRIYRKKYLLLILWFLPNLILYLILGSLAAALLAVALGLYYVVLVLFFLRILCKTAFSCRSTKGTIAGMERNGR